MEAAQDISPGVFLHYHIVKIREMSDYQKTGCQSLDPHLHY